MSPRMQLRSATLNSPQHCRRGIKVGKRRLLSGVTVTLHFRLRISLSNCTPRLSTSPAQYFASTWRLRMRKRIAGTLSRYTFPIALMGWVYRIDGRCSYTSHARVWIHILNVISFSSIKTANLRVKENQSQLMKLTHHSAISDSYESKPWFAKVNQQVTDAFRSRLDWVGIPFANTGDANDAKEVRLLDYACGTGLMTRVSQIYHHVKKIHTNKISRPSDPT
jgi:hypothetical protein